MFYLSRLRPRSLYNYAYYSIKMNRTQVEGVDSQDEGSNECGQDQIEPGKKRVNMPKKSKHRTRAHVNPMGDLNIPT